MVRNLASRSSPDQENGGFRPPHFQANGQRGTASSAHVVSVTIRKTRGHRFLKTTATSWSVPRPDGCVAKTPSSNPGTKAQNRLGRSTSMSAAQRIFLWNCVFFLCFVLFFCFFANARFSRNMNFCRLSKNQPSALRLSIQKPPKISWRGLPPAQFMSNRPRPPTTAS